MDDTVDRDLRARTMLAVSIAAAEMNDLIGEFIPLIGREERMPSLIEATRGLRAMYGRMRVLSVLHARIVMRRPWESIAAELRVGVDTALAMYEPMEQRWQAGDPAPWAPTEAPDPSRQAPPVAGPIDLPGPVADHAAALDERIRATLPRIIATYGPRPISDGLPEADQADR